jgi:hypothetical protein
MSHKDKDDVVISAEGVLNKIEQICGVIKLKWILLATGAGMLFYLIVFIGIFTSNSVHDRPNEAAYDFAPPPTPFPVVEHVEEPAPVIVETEDGSEYSAAHDFGARTGEILIFSRDAMIDFWNGFDETTGASDWARAHWDSGRERMTEWVEENFPPTDHTDDDYE